MAQGYRTWSGYASPGFGAGYHAARPAPPPALLELLCRIARVERPALVADLGSGTGLSTRGWGSLADEVVGIEPNDEMRREAEANTSYSNVRYLDAYSEATGLPGASADIVTCSQALHWMQPEPTFAEVARILRPGGVFAAYDYEFPPAVDWEVDAAFEELLRRVSALRLVRLGIHPADKAGHLDRIRASGRFRYARELLLHAETAGGAEDLLVLPYSLGPVTRLLAEGATEDELGLTALREVAGGVLGERRVAWTWGYRVRVAVR